MSYTDESIHNFTRIPFLWEKKCHLNLNCSLLFKLFISLKNLEWGFESVPDPFYIRWALSAQAQTLTSATKACIMVDVTPV